jgi:hypothetical protein
MSERLYIKVDENKVFIGHPRFEANLKTIFPDHDFDQGPPPEHLPFERVEPPKLGVYQKFDATIGGNIAIAFDHNGLSYELVDGVYKDVWYVLEMTEEEISALQQATKDDWAANDGPASWVFNEEKCAFEPPMPYPEDGQAYTWDEATISWVALIPE